MIRYALPFLLLGSPAAIAADLRVIDGDTFDLDGERIRIENIDAPETYRPKCPDEAVLAFHAKERLAALLAPAVVEGRITIVRNGEDIYHRTLARVTLNGTDVGEQLVAEAPAVPWEGHRHDWCR